jgi:estrogen-related receptor beta like 1
LWNTKAGQTKQKQLQTQLVQVEKDLDVSLDKIKAREKYLNAHFESQKAQYTSLLQSLSELKLREKEVRERVEGKSKELSTVSEQLEEVKKQMDELGSTMTNAAPLQWIKTAVQNLKVGWIQ